MQAATAVKDGLEAGKIRQQLVLLLPVNEKEVDFNSTEPVDYPCSVFKARLARFPVCLYHHHTGSMYGASVQTILALCMAQAPPRVQLHVQCASGFSAITV